MAKDRKKSDKRAPAGTKARKSGKRPPGTPKSGRRRVRRARWIRPGRPARGRGDRRRRRCSPWTEVQLVGPPRRAPTRPARGTRGRCRAPSSIPTRSSRRPRPGRWRHGRAWWWHRSDSSQLATFADPDRDPRTRVVSVGFVAVTERATPPAGGKVGQRSLVAGRRGGGEEGTDPGLRPRRHPVGRPRHRSMPDSSHSDLGIGLIERAVHPGRPPSGLRGGVGRSARAGQLPAQGTGHTRIRGGHRSGADGDHGPAGRALPTGVRRPPPSADCSGPADAAPTRAAPDRSGSTGQRSTVRITRAGLPTATAPGGTHG